MKNIILLGSTGSIGTSALSVVDDFPDEVKVVAMTAHSNHELFLKQIDKYKPEVIAVSDPQSAKIVASKTNLKVLEGTEGLIEAATYDGADFVLSSIVGAAGLAPTLAAVKKGSTIGLANKETLVVAGDAMMAEAKKSGANILPVDSEHSAVFQCLEGRDPATVNRIILTASGGPFVGKTKQELESMTPTDALKHPSWTMGRKISIDSATLMNKGLEVIEAHYLFGVSPDKIDVVVHPQSIVHSMVEFIDGSVLAQLSIPDMRGAIAYAISYPGRFNSVMKPLDLPTLGRLTFDSPDLENFPCLAYAYDALRAGGTMPAVLNAANEVAVDAFLSGAIGFTEIPVIIKKAMDSHKNSGTAGIDDVTSAHQWSESTARSLIG